MVKAEVDNITKGPKLIAVQARSFSFCLLFSKKITRLAAKGI